jgi:hypothetical protein
MGPKRIHAAPQSGSIRSPHRPVKHGCGDLDIEGRCGSLIDEELEANGIAMTAPATVMNSRRYE